MSRVHEDFFFNCVDDVSFFLGFFFFEEFEEIYVFVAFDTDENLFFIEMCILLSSEESFERKKKEKRKKERKEICFKRHGWKKDTPKEKQ